MVDEKKWGPIALAAILLLGPPAANGEGAPAAAPSPGDLLRRMSAELKKAGSYRFHAEVCFDDVLVSGQKLQYAGAADFTVRVPDGVYVDYRDDLSAKRFWYDGKTGTLLDLFQGTYSQVELADNIDAAVDQLQAQYDLALPLADLISTDVYQVIDAKALAWAYIGVHDVEGALAHHVAVLGENADVQFWIQKDGPPLPLKLVITYNSIGEAPQYQAVLMDWKLGASLPADHFRPVLPESARRIEFLVGEDRR